MSPCATARIFNLEMTMKGAFDWSLGGRSLVYVADQPALSGMPGRSELHFSEDLEVFSHQYFTGVNSQNIDNVPFPQHFRAVSWVPHSLMVASLVGSDEEDCWTVRLSNAYSREQLPRGLSGLVRGGQPEPGQLDAGWKLAGADRPAAGKKKTQPFTRCACLNWWTGKHDQRSVSGSRPAPLRAVGRAGAGTGGQRLPALGLSLTCVLLGAT